MNKEREDVNTLSIILKQFEQTIKVIMHFYFEINFFL